MKPDIVLMTDFGLATGYVGSMYGVIRKIDQSLGIFDLNHEIKVFDIRQASSLLADTVMYWKDGTVFVSVVDPGVGTSRRSCVALLDNGSYVVTPDNGTLTKLLDRVVKVREIDEKVNRLKGSERANSFHGRDVYAFTAARLAGGVIDYAGVGAEYPLSEIVRFETTVGFVSEGYAKGRITGCLRHFGSPETDISVSDFEKTGIKYGDFVNVTISRRGEVLFKERVLFHKSFGYVPEGEPILCNGSTSPYMEISLNKRSFAEERLPHIFDAGEEFTDYEIEISKA
ncbi:MAG: SAM hydrolase/SAM-dependent halogenase family protein [Sphaerochaetaceae bacterium]